MPTLFLKNSEYQHLTTMINNANRTISPSQPDGQRESMTNPASNPVADPSNSSAQTTNTGQPRRSPFSMAEMDKEWSSFITLRNRAQSANFTALPRELKFHIFQQLPHTALFDRSLFALACTSTIWRAEVKAYLTPERTCMDFGGKLLHPAGLRLWQAEGQQLIKQTQRLREEFDHSKQCIAQALSSKAGVQGMTEALTQLSGFALDFRSIDYSDELGDMLSKCRDQTIKLYAGSIGRKRFLPEVLPALSKIPAGCRVVLNASRNDLQPDDMLFLLNIIKNNPCIYHLDLSDNPLCQGQQVCKPIVELFHTPSPLSHLYLAGTGLNDATACQISQPLATNPCLQHLDLRNNLLFEIGALALINALATTSKTDEIHTNTVLRALRLQENHYGNNNQKVCSAILQAHLLVAKAGNPKFDPLNDDLTFIVQIDGVGHGLNNFRFEQIAWKLHFEKIANAERL